MFLHFQNKNITRKMRYSDLCLYLNSEDAEAERLLQVPSQIGIYRKERSLEGEEGGVVNS